MLSVFGDESHDQTKARVFVVAGLLGSAKDWESLRDRWKERLDGIIFHASDCESGYGDFSETKECDRLQLHRDLTETLAGSRIMGYGAAIDLEGCRQVAPDVFKEFPDMAYYDCFVRVIKHFADLAGLIIPRDRVEFTFDQHRETQYNAGLLYDWVSHYQPEIVEKVSFGNRKEPGIQAADLWARELMKRCDSSLFNDRSNPRPQWKRLSDTRRFKASFMRGPDFAHDLEESRDLSSNALINAREYEKWRTDRGLMDNLSNRFRYHAMMDLAKNEFGHGKEL